MPYTYGLAWQAHRLGLPLMRPLVLHDPDDPRFWDSSSAYLWGDDILVAPVTRAGATHWPVSLPRGRWFDFWTGDAHEGGGAVCVPAPLDRLPLFIRAGAIIPMGPVQQHSSTGAPEEIILAVYPGEPSRCVLYEDDGTTRKYRDGQCVATECTGEMHGTELTLHIGAPVGNLSLLPVHRRYCVRIHTTERPRDMRLAGNPDATMWKHDGAHTLSVAIDQHPATLTVRW
jgi:alpha-glucosidase (family GH31 glycosyl hydrolase)